MRAKQDERTDWIGTTQRENFRMLLPQRFRNENVAVEPVGQAKSGCNPEWQTRTNVSKGPANSRSQNKTETERDPDHPKSAGAFLLRDDIRDIGHGGRDAGGGDSRDDAADEQPANGRRERHHNVIKPETKIRQQDYRPSSEPIR